VSGSGEYDCNNNAPRAIAVKVWQVAWPFARLAAAVLANVLWIGALGYALVRLLEAECRSLHVNAIVRLVEISDVVLKISAFGGHEPRNLVA
jgi:hypothetical protein